MLLRLLKSILEDSKPYIALCDDKARERDASVTSNVNALGGESSGRALKSANPLTG